MENELKSFRLNLVIAPSQVGSIDNWRKSQPDLPSRSEAVRRLVDIGIKGEPILEEFLKFLLVLKSKPEYDGSLNKQIDDLYVALQKTTTE